MIILQPIDAINHLLGSGNQELSGYNRRSQDPLGIMSRAPSLEVEMSRFFKN